MRSRSPQLSWSRLASSSTGARGRFAACSQRAFSLVELLLVLVLLTIMLLVALPNLSTARKGSELTESVSRMKALAGMCRAQAMNDARRFRIQFRADGSIIVERQVDPLTAPQDYEPVAAPWATTDYLLETVWVEAVQPLPEGPAPILLDKEQIEFQQIETDPTLVTELEQPLVLDFEPDGSCSSLRWVLRDSSGRGLRMVLDGRLGRVTTEDVDRLEPDAVQRPEKLAEEPAPAATGRGKRSERKG